MKLADRSERAKPPLLEDRLAARPEFAVGAAQQRRIGPGAGGPRAGGGAKRRHCAKLGWRRDKILRWVLRSGEEGGGGVTLAGFAEIPAPKFVVPPATSATPAPSRRENASRVASRGRS